MLDGQMRTYSALYLRKKCKQEIMVWFDVDVFMFSWNQGQGFAAGVWRV